MNIFEINGQKTAIINMFIDPENGFLRFGLSDGDGGVLYVPGGEEVPGIMANIIDGSHGSIFVIGQDYHPANHISFMVNHSGIMDYRIEQYKALLKENGQPIPQDEDELYEQAQQPVHFFDGMDNPPTEFPFPEVVLNENKNIVGLKELDGRIRKVEVGELEGGEPGKHNRGRVTAVTNDFFETTYDDYLSEGTLLNTQTLWTKHCVQGTLSCQYPDELNLPQGLVDKIKSDLTKPTIFFRDDITGNEFWVIRKGMNSELDSYGIGVENDGQSLTKAWDVFSTIASELKRRGCEKVIINGGGLATNFCTEFSLNNTADFLAGQFKMKGMDVDINFVPEISRGIPIPGGPEVPFSLEGTAARLKARGVNEISVKDILALAPKQPASLQRSFPDNLQPA